MILYPRLLREKNVNNNNLKNIFWNIILERLSIGDAPFGTRIVDNFLWFRKKSISLEEGQISDIMNFFKEEVGLQLQYVYFSSWKEIKRKIIKDNLIQDYVGKFQKENNLNMNQTNYLSSMIHLYITLKKITHQDIILNTNPYTHITQIKGIIYDKNTDNIIFEPDNLHSISEEIQEELDDDDE